MSERSGSVPLESESQMLSVPAPNPLIEPPPARLSPINPDASHHGEGVGAKETGKVLFPQTSYFPVVTVVVIIVNEVAEPVLGEGTECSEGADVGPGLAVFRSENPLPEGMVFILA
jgi:hypothetical protein